MNILKQMAEVFESPTTHEEYLRGWKDQIAHREQDYKSGAVEYYHGYGDAYAALECLGSEVKQ